MKTIFTAGCATLDTLVYVDEFFDKQPQTVFTKKSYETVGGTGVGKALALTKLFDKVTFHCMLGTDRDGKYIKKVLQQNKVSLIYDNDPAGTEKHINIMDNHGGRISLYVKYATFNPKVNLKKIERYVKKSDIVVLNIINYCRELIPIIKKYNKEIWCDIHDFDGKNPYHDDFIAAADYIFMSSDAMSNYREFMTDLIKSGKKLVVCTHGRKGSTILDANMNFTDLPVIDSYERIDTNGAGDNFMSGFLYAFAEGKCFAVCQKYATIAAGLYISSKDIVHNDLSADKIERDYATFYKTTT